MPIFKPKYIETRLFISGEFTDSTDKKTFKVVSPTTNEIVAEVAEASEASTCAAVAAAKAAFPTWAALSPKQRGVYFKRLAALIREARDELAYLEAISMGRPVGDYCDAGAAAYEFDYYAETGYDAQGTSSLNTPGYVNVSFRQPYGVVAAIIPWNVPVLFFSNKTAPALAAGNTVVVKSSEKAPLTSAKLATLVQQAGFPPGVINVISGHGPVSGAILSSHMDVRAITFTGSAATGRIIAATAAKSNLKHVLLELGGKCPAIIFDDADLERAAEETQYSAHWNSGQACMANSRIYVQNTIADKFIALFKEKFAKNAKPGDPTNEVTNQGPQADVLQYNHVRRLVELGKSTGRLELGGDMEEAPKNGFYVPPTIFTSTPEDAEIMKTEVFGPVVNINVFATESEVIQKANDTEYGLYASVYTKNLDRAMRFGKALEAGTIAVNATGPVFAVDMPFGGLKSSGWGRESLKNSLNNFLETKTVMFRMEEEKS